MASLCESKKCPRTKVHTLTKLCPKPAAKSRRKKISELIDAAERVQIMLREDGEWCGCDLYDGEPERCPPCALSDALAALP